METNTKIFAVINLWCPWVSNANSQWSNSGKNPCKLEKTMAKRQKTYFPWAVCMFPGSVMPGVCPRFRFRSKNWNWSKKFVSLGCEKKTWFRLFRIKEKQQKYEEKMNKNKRNEAKRVNLKIVSQYRSHAVRYWSQHAMILKQRFYEPWVFDSEMTTYSKRCCLLKESEWSA